MFVCRFFCRCVDIVDIVCLEVCLDNISYLVFKYNKIDNKNRNVI